MTYTYRWCNFDYETLVTISLYSYILTSICSFVGNLLVILTVYINKNLRTSTNYFIVSMSVSDILFPLFVLLVSILLDRRVSQVSKLIGNLLCKLLLYIVEVSVLTLVTITVYRFFAVMFPMRARVQNKRKRIFVLLLTWVIPMAIWSPFLVILEFDENDQTCFYRSKPYYLIWIAADLSLLRLLPLLIMLVLYPLIIIKLMKEKVPGNVHCDQVVIKRRKQNFRLTMMLIVLTVTFLLCWGPHIIHWLLTLILKLDRCNFFYLFFVAFRITPVVFHAINPVIYFIFLSSFRQGFKNIFRSSCCNRTRP